MPNEKITLSANIRKLTLGAGRGWRNCYCVHGGGAGVAKKISALCREPEAALRMVEAALDGAGDKIQLAPCEGEFSVHAAINGGPTLQSRGELNKITFHLLPQNAEGDRLTLFEIEIAERYAVADADQVILGIVHCLNQGGVLTISLEKAQGDLPFDADEEEAPKRGRKRKNDDESSE